MYLQFHMACDAFDVIGFDPRGVGASEPSFACGVPGQQFALLDAIDDYLDTAEEYQAGERAAELCTASMGRGSAHATTCSFAEACTG